MTNPAEDVALSQTQAVPAAPIQRERLRVRPLANRNFRLLWLGESVSMLGDQFYLVALPWLVFQMTGSALAFGTILMVAGVPRAMFMLVGGVMTDRLSPRAVMIASNLLRLAITALLTLLVACQATQLWVLYMIAFSFGLVDAFFYPAYRAMIPLIVDAANLQASNALHQGTSQLIQIAGPGAAGVMVRSVGLALSFAFDALTFLFTSVLLSLMRPVAPPHKTGPEAAHKRSILAEIGEMLAYVRCDTFLSALLLVVSAVNLLFVGPLVVGAATLGRVRFVEGSAAFGAMLSTFSVGALIGTLAAGAVHSRRSGVISLLLLAAQGLFMVGLAQASTLVIACGLLALMGLGAGFGNVTLITLTQRRVARDKLGRFMSLIALAEVGLTPVSNALAGVMADLNVTAMYKLAGGLLTLVSLLAVANPVMRNLDV